MKQSNESTLKESIRQLIDNYRLSDKLDETKISIAWEKLVGKMIANHTTSIFIKNKVLFVALDNAALKEELKFAKSRMITLLNKKFEKNIIEDIVFR